MMVTRGRKTLAGEGRASAQQRPMAAPTLETRAECARLVASAYALLRHNCIKTTPSNHRVKHIPHRGTRAARHRLIDEAVAVSASRTSQGYFGFCGRSPKRKPRRL